MSEDMNNNVQETTEVQETQTKKVCGLDKLFGITARGSSVKTEIVAGIVTFLQGKYDLDVKGVNDVLNKKSGFLGVSGVSSDARDIEAAAKEGNHRAALAMEMFRYRVKKFIGAYAAAMNGVDMVVFTGGIGENDMSVREDVCTGCSFLGIDFDVEANKVRGEDRIITKPGSKVVVTTVTTNEELVIAQETMRLTTK